VAKTKSTSIELPAVERCPNCKGSGSVMGLFYEQFCPQCNGAGIIREDGEHLAAHDACLILLRRMHRLEQALKTEKDSKKPVDPYSGASDRLGGRFVMD
jgi:hypothetical protein